MKKYILSGLIITLLLIPVISCVALDLGTNTYMNNFKGNAGYGNASLADTVGKIVQIVLSLLGLVAVILVIIGGFMWMTSGGNEEKIASAKKLMGSALIGLIIVVLAYTVSNFFIEKLTTITNQ